ncbi:MAG: beta-lactamase family protein [Actinobacteria bacterium]|nr:beta-lactamase family protein [Actinomycetota bacterium]
MPSAALAAATALLQTGIDEGVHLGAQLCVSRRGEVVADIAVGEARRGVAMTPDTLLPWFSGTKALTAVAVAQQWERGEILLDDAVAAHVPEFAAAGKEGVTVRDLLTHTAGLRNAELAGSETDGVSWEEGLAAVCAASLYDEWVPGERAAYQPKGTFLVLAELVRLVDGRPFAEYLRDEIFRPLDMVDSWLVLPPDRADAYGERLGVMHDTSSPEAGARPLADSIPPDARPSSGAMGPAHDLVRLYQTLLRGGRPVLSPQAVEAMTARHRTSLRDETFGAVIDWGLGLMVNSWHYREQPAPYGYGDRASRRAFGHGGSQSSIAFADPEHDLAVVLLTNGMAGEKGNHRRTQPVLTAVYEDLAL